MSRLSAADVEACFREFDRDGDKKLSYDEFCAMMNTRRDSLELLLEHHTDGKEKQHQNGQKYIELFRIACCGIIGGPIGPIFLLLGFYCKWTYAYCTLLNWPIRWTI